MVVVPAATPVMIPVLEPAVATAVLLLDQVPPVIASVSSVVAPLHTAVVPNIAVGVGLTVRMVVAVHPPATV